MQFTLNKEEITDLIHEHVKGLFKGDNEIVISLSTKAKTGIYANITVQHTKTVTEPVKTLAELPVETIEEVVSEEPITTEPKSLFTKPID